MSSKIFQNKQQLIHIASEFIIIIAVVYYFSSKNRKLLQYIEDLSQRLDEHEEVIKKQEKLINKLLSINYQPPTDTKKKPKQPPQPQQPQQPPKNSLTKLTVPTEESATVEEIVDDESVILDKEIEEELRELNENGLD